MLVFLSLVPGGQNMASKADKSGNRGPSILSSKKTNTKKYNLIN